MADQGVNATAAMKSIGIAAVDESELVALCQKLLAANPKTIADVQKRQSAGDWSSHRPGQEAESQHRPKPLARNLSTINSVCHFIANWCRHG